MNTHNAEDGAQANSSNNRQKLLGKGIAIFEGKALSWEVLLLSIHVQVGKGIRRRQSRQERGEASALGGDLMFSSHCSQFKLPKAWLGLPPVLSDQGVS